MNAIGQPPELFEIPILAEDDIVRARARGREICRTMGLSEINQVKVATAISELARNVFQYAGKGLVTLRKLGAPRPGIEVIAKDEGPGIPDIQLVLSGTYKSKTGMGKGLLGCRRLVDHFEVESVIGSGTTVLLRKYVR